MVSHCNVYCLVGKLVVVTGSIEFSVETLTARRGRQVNSIACKPISNLKIVAFCWPMKGLCRIKLRNKRF